MARTGSHPPRGDCVGDAGFTAFQGQGAGVIHQDIDVAEVGADGANHLRQRRSVTQVDLIKPIQQPGLLWRKNVQADHSGALFFNVQAAA